MRDLRKKRGIEYQNSLRIDHFLKLKRKEKNVTFENKFWGKPFNDLEKSIVTLQKKALVRKQKHWKNDLDKHIKHIEN